MPAASDQLLRDLRGARGWVFVPEAVFFANVTACLIDTSISKVSRLAAQHTNAIRGGMQVQCDQENECRPSHAAARTTQMRLRLCRPSVLAAELKRIFSAYRPRIKEGGR